MKKPFFVSVLLWLFLFGFSSHAANIAIDEARKIALHVYTGKANTLDVALKTAVSAGDEFVLAHEGQAVMYIFNIKNGGWVILSADDRVVPVLAFALSGEIDPSKAPPAFMWMLDGYAKQIHHVIMHDIPSTPETDNMWRQAGSETGGAKGEKSVAPLLSCLWNQGKYYNRLCPEDPNGPDGRVYSGCVATCMAQVMYYYRHPAQGNGSHGYYSDYGYLNANFGATTYEWDAMEDRINNLYNIPMALIQYHCGIAVNMNYSPSGSGAYMWNAASAMKNYFGYAPSLELLYKDDYSESVWKSMLIAELDAKRPLCYAGFGNGGGHAFNCDGYQGSDYFHFNWGWGGSGNGYFYMDNLNPSYTFTNGQQAIFGIYPASGYPGGCSGTKTYTAVRGTLDDGSGPVHDYANGADCLYLIDPAIPVQKIFLTFEKFHTENAEDIVTVYDGASVTDSVLGIFSGSTVPGMIASSGSKLLIRFTTNSSVGAPGWFASYRSAFPVYCSSIAEFTEPSGSFGDGSGNNPYNNQTLCRWRIAPPGATGITIHFDSFELEANDFVKIYDAAGNFAVATFYGGAVPGSIFVFTSKVLVLFKSDNFGVANGFQASYTSSNSGLDDHAPQTTLSVFPNPATDYLHITASGATSSVYTFRIFTSAGREVMNRKYIPESGLINESLNISTFAGGLYNLVIESTHATQSVRFIKK